MTQRPPTRRGALGAGALGCAAVVSTFVALLAACGDESPTSDSARAAGSGAVVTMPSSTDPSTPVPLTTDASGATCLVGRWVVTDAALRDYFDVVAENTAFDSIESTGTIAVSFTPTEFDWRNDFELVATIGDESYATAQAGSLSGTYTGAAGILMGAVTGDDRTATFTRDGRPIDGDPGDLFAGLSPARPMDELAFACDGPTITLPAGPAPGDVAIVTLRPA